MSSSRSGDRWLPLPLNKPLYANLDEDAVVGYQTAIENGFVNSQGGHTRFPGLSLFADFGGDARVYLHDFNGDLIAADSRGQVRRLDRNAHVEDLTAVPVAGGRRVVFAKTDRELLMAAGGPIVRLRATQTELLSSAAPLATHVASLDNYTIAVEINSGRFFHSGPGTPDQWDPLDTFAADGNPDNINSLLVTPARELMLGGEDSVEQFERTDSGDAPFARRWAIGAGGVKLPYAIIYADNYVWTINNRRELVRFAGQVQQVVSQTFGRLLEAVDDWSDAWMGGYPDRPLHILGQKFMILQAPNATNAYGTKGLTLLFDYENGNPHTLYGFDRAAGLPSRWPGWSHWTLWDRVFVGGQGKIYELDQTVHRNGSDTQRWLIRTSHMASGGGVIVKNFRLRLVRGGGTSSTASTIRVRCSRDGRPFGSWVSRTLGKAGERQQQIEFGNFGSGLTHRFEISCTDDCAVDLIGADVKTDPLGH
jgi:hypothetical protein